MNKIVIYSYFVYKYIFFVTDRLYINCVMTDFRKRGLIVFSYKKQHKLFLFRKLLV